jgi:uncharacterized protein YunC (DUF1805 family)
MIELVEVKVDGKVAIGIKVQMPDAPPLIVIRGEKGVVFCGYLNPESAEKLSLSAVIVRGVNTVDEALAKPISYYTKKAEALGVKVGMSGREALRLFL